MATQTSTTPSLSPEDQAEIERRFQLVRSVGEECITEADLKNLITKRLAAGFRLYDGFEPSGRMHIAQGIFKALNVNKCTSSGGTFVFWIADWFALMNDKMGGDLEKIKVVGQYFIEVWKGAGMDLTNVEFRWASDDIIGNAQVYWQQMLDIAMRFTTTRIKKCCQIMGRLENKLTAAQILYPLMQCTDIFFLRADICQLGVDQRKVNMLAREYCDAIGRKLKPVILSHHMLYGLAKGQAKMSKSNPDSAIFMEDSVEEVKRKLGIAYCPREVEEEQKKNEGEGEESMSLVEDKLKNPCLDYVKYIIMSEEGSVLNVEVDNGTSNKAYKSYEAVREAFLSGELTEDELKAALAKRVNELMQPVRDHFQNDPTAQKVLKLVKEYKREAVQPPKCLKRCTALFPKPLSVIAVFVPLPLTPTLNLGTLLSTRQALITAEQQKKKMEEVTGEGQKVVLYVQDLNAIALGCFGQDKKLKATDCITAGVELFVTCLGKLYNPVASGDVQVLKQSEQMLSDPSNYWVSVINVGRHFQLQEVQDAITKEERNRVGSVVSALMHVGDMLALAPSALVSTEDASESLHKLGSTYISACASQENAFGAPLLLKQPCVVDALPILSVHDTKAEVKKKVNQAFCEPGNVSKNPVLALIEALVFTSHVSSPDSPTPSLQISRSEEHGGNLEYSNFEDLQADFESQKVHPSDLKPAAVAQVLKTYSNSLSPALQTAAKASKQVLNYVRRQKLSKK